MDSDLSQRKEEVITNQTKVKSSVTGSGKSLFYLYYKMFIYTSNSFNIFLM